MNNEDNTAANNRCTEPEDYTVECESAQLSSTDIGTTVKTKDLCKVPSRLLGDSSRAYRVHVVKMSFHGHFTSMKVK